jgi:hypothetical protein
MTQQPDNNSTNTTEGKQDNWRLLRNAGTFLWDIVVQSARTLRALLFMIIKTPYMLLPSSATSTTVDEQYNRTMIDKLVTLVEQTDLKENGKETIELRIVKDDWIGQIQWTNNRATRERDANELIRWWQIILGVIIPVVASTDFAGKDVFVSVAGIFIAILTAVYQFRRPEERWRHYRILTERYQNELRDYITLSDEHYKGFESHKDAFKTFNKRMTEIKEDDLMRFFGEVVPKTTFRNGKLEQQPAEGENVQTNPAG